MPILYEHPLSPYVHKVKIALGEKKIPFETRMPDILGGSDLDTFVAMNPRLEVPTLVDGDATIFDSTIILEYVEERWPDPPLLPAAPVARAGADDRRGLRHLLRGHQLGRHGDPGLPARNRRRGRAPAVARARAERRRADLARTTPRGRSLLRRRALRWADCAVAPYVHASATFGNGPAEGTPLAAWLARIVTRPSVASTFEAAAASMRWVRMLPGLSRRASSSAKYRDHRLEWMLRAAASRSCSTVSEREYSLHTRVFVETPAPRREPS
jgi:RNA polymerase-associated protein